MLRSVLDQTYPNIELIVVDDCSTDDTEKQLEKYKDKILYIHKENGGVSSAVNAGLQVAKGKYIARLDDDDLFMPEKVSKQVDVLEGNPNAGMVISACFLTDSQGRITSLREPPDFSEYPPLLTLLLKYLILQPMVMVRRECHDKLGFYKHTFAEDYEMFLRLSRYFGVEVIHVPLAKCRRHPGNITRELAVNEGLRQDIGSFIRDKLDDVELPELFPDVDSASDDYL